MSNIVLSSSLLETSIIYNRDFYRLSSYYPQIKPLLATIRASSLSLFETSNIQYRDIWDIDNSLRQTIYQRLSELHNYLSLRNALSMILTSNYSTCTVRIRHWKFSQKILILVFILLSYFISPKYQWSSIRVEIVAWLRSQLLLMIALFTRTQSSFFLDLVGYRSQNEG